MAPVNPLRAAWAAGRVTYGGWVSTPDTLVAEFMAAAGFDEVCADQQHATIDVPALAALFQAIEARGVVPTTRVAKLDVQMIGASLDLGAMAVIVPLVETPDQAAELVAACRYPPTGIRSIGPTRAIHRAGPSLDRLGDVAAIAMIETVRGLENVERIAAVPGLDAVYVGPGDLAISLGLPLDRTQRSPADIAAHWAAVDRIRAAADAAGIVAGAYCGSGAVARDYVRRGFRMVAAAWDGGLLENGSRAELAVARGG